MAIAEMNVEPGWTKPVLSSAHVPPPSVLLKSPLKVTAYRVVGVTGSATSLPMVNGGSPVLLGAHVPPAFALLRRLALLARTAFAVGKSVEFVRPAT